jgi:hypothetical protein
MLPEMETNVGKFCFSRRRKFRRRIARGFGGEGVDDIVVVFSVGEIFLLKPGTKTFFFRSVVEVLVSQRVWRVSLEEANVRNCASDDCSEEGNSETSDKHGRVDKRLLVDGVRSRQRKKRDEEKRRDKIFRDEVFEASWHDSVRSFVLSHHNRFFFRVKENDDP